MARSNKESKERINTANATAAAAVKEEEVVRMPVLVEEEELEIYSPDEIVGKIIWSPLFDKACLVVSVGTYFNDSDVSMVKGVFENGKVLGFGIAKRVFAYFLKKAATKRPDLKVSSFPAYRIPVVEKEKEQPEPKKVVPITKNKNRENLPKKDIKSSKPSQEPKDKAAKALKAPKKEDMYKPIIDELQIKCGGVDNLLAEAKKRGITWVDTEYKQITILRAKMAMKKFFEAGNKW